MYAFIVPDIVSSNIDRYFLYKVPEDLEEKLFVGIGIRVPFGRYNKEIFGYVVDLTEKIDKNDIRLNGKNIDDMKLKNIICIDSKATDLSKSTIELALWMKKNYGSTLAAAIRTVNVSKENIKIKKPREIILTKDNDYLKEYIKSKLKNAKARLRLIEFLIENQIVDYDFAKKELKISNEALKKLQEDKIIIVNEKINKYKKDILIDKIKLNEYQESVTDDILNFAKENYKKPPVALLYGVTGSGKTSIYIKIVEEVLKEKKQAIILIPEISLTLQNITRFYRIFGDRVSFIHSKLSKSERYERINRAKNGEIDIMIGPRTALFTPFKNIGVIIIDEEHESSYKSEKMPKYDAVDVAVHLAKIHNSLVVLGSATPSIVSFYKALNNEYKLFKLEKRYGNATLPSVSIVDMRVEMANGNRTMFSQKLNDLIYDRLQKKEQIMLFLNRRGLYSFNTCRECGTVIKCPHCDVSLSLHSDGFLRCHYCGYSHKAYATCPSCNSKYIGGFNAGTQQVEEYLKLKFPNAKILRMDADTTSKKNSTDEIIENFAGHKADILIGTQMIVKGHDFSKVTLMGILMADLSLNISEYTSSERCFQLLMQASGRSGRSTLKGEVVLQTYNPNHFCIRQAALHNYIAFYEQEIAYRKLLNYPPFSYFLLITMQYDDEKYLDISVNFMKKFLIIAAKKYNIEVIGPSIPIISKINNIYRRFIYIKHKKYDRLIFIRKLLENYISINKGYDKIDIQFDYKPN